MTMRFRGFLCVMLVAAATLILAGCGHYKCNATFGASSCSPTGTGIGTGNGNGAVSQAIYYIANGGNTRNIGSAELTANAGMINTPGFSNPALPSLVTVNYSYSLTIASKKFVYVPYGPSSQLFGWSINSATEDLVPVTGSPYTASYAAGIPSVFEIMQPSVTTPNGNFLFIADAADQQIISYQIDPVAGTLTQSPGSPLSTSAVIAPWNVATDGQGRFLYVTEGNTIGEGLSMAVYSIDQTTGALSGGTVLPYNMWQVQGDPSGTFLVGNTGEVGRGTDLKVDQHIYVFSINQSTGTITPVSGSPFVTTFAPNWVIIHPNGKFVYTFGIDPTTNGDSPLEGFSMDSTTGFTMPLANSPFTNVLVPFGGMFDQTGANLFLHVPNELGYCTVDSTTGIPTQSTSTLHIAGNLPWAVTDTQ